jgi:hypothetical protein
MDNESVKIPKKRGRKPKNKDVVDPDTGALSNAPINENILNEDGTPKPKKRGRKPKGGKIVAPDKIITNNVDDEPSNIILHLKCCLKDLTENTHMEDNIDPFSFQNNSNLDLSYVNNKQNDKMPALNNSVFINVTKEIDPVQGIDDTSVDSDDLNEYKNKEKTMKGINIKLKELQKNLHNNNIDDKKSACFWCTYDFDNPPIFIPKYHIKSTYHVYGCFCSPECATAYLMKEDIDKSSKFERYYLLNYIYSKIYDYKTSIKPAPNPEYTLDKFYGNLSIQEYRSLLKNDRLFLVVDKPLTRLLPELHEDTDDFIISNKTIPCSSYNLKKHHKKEVKTDILNKTFGLA